MSEKLRDRKTRVKVNLSVDPDVLGEVKDATDNLSRVTEGLWRKHILGEPEVSSDE